jgi:hypothetical protein
MSATSYGATQADAAVVESEPLISSENAAAEDPAKKV